MALTLKELAIECLKQVDKGNGERIVMIKNDTRFGNFNPIFNDFNDNDDIVGANVKTAQPSKYILLG